ncbi:MAG: hypothetical protein AB1782_12625 [Cyanobacteriota bacterium]
MVITSLVCITGDIKPDIPLDEDEKVELKKAIETNISAVELKESIQNKTQENNQNSV